MSSFAIISDVHANLEALNTVLRKIEEDNVDAILFLGDSVGYGPEPDECIEVLTGSAKILLAGNHDRAAAGLSDMSSFNPYAKAAIEWTRDKMSKENIAFLKELPLTAEINENDMFLVHSTPKEPEQWHYLTFEHDARVNFKYFEQIICFLGHSHIPFIVEASPGGNIRFHYRLTEIKDNCRYIVNAGSVGQPRDGNPDAAYALMKGNTVEIKRVSYDIVLTQKKMRKAGLPSYLIERLAVGR